MLRPTDSGGPCSYFRWAVCDRLSRVLIRICNESWSITYGQWDENWEWEEGNCLIYRSASAWSPDFTETSWRGIERWRAKLQRALTSRNDWGGLNILHRSKWDYKIFLKGRRRREITKFGLTTTSTKYSFLNFQMTLEWMHMQSGDVW